MPPLDTSDLAPMPEPGGELLSDVLNRLDAARAGFFEATNRYATLPTNTYGERVVLNVEFVIGAMRDCAMHVLRDNSVEVQEKGNIIATLVEDDEQIRVAHLGSLTANKVPFSEVAVERQTIVESIANGLLAGANWDELLEKFMHVYRNNVVVDLEKFMEHVPNSRNARLLRFGQAFGKQVLDVSKTTAGVAAGIALAKHLARRRNT